MDFISALKAFLETAPSFQTSREKILAQQLIQEHYLDTKPDRVNLKYGLCLLCRTTKITYRVCSTHIALTDDWLIKTFARWEDGVFIDTRFMDRVDKISINGIQFKTAMGYLCEPCLIKLREHIEKVRAETIKRKRENEYNRDMNRIAGVGKVTVSQRFWALREHFTEEDMMKIKALPYQEFLRSNYWKIISAYKKYKAGGQCDLCNGERQLNTHHRTYEHYGQEINSLDDLIVLCEPCHAKHHDKLAANQTV